MKPNNHIPNYTTSHHLDIHCQEDLRFSHQGMNYTKNNTESKGGWGNSWWTSFQMRTHTFQFCKKGTTVTIQHTRRCSCCSNYLRSVVQTLTDCSLFVKVKTDLSTLFKHVWSQVHLYSHKIKSVLEFYITHCSDLIWQNLIVWNVLRFPSCKWKPSLLFLSPPPIPIHMLGSLCGAFKCCLYWQSICSHVTPSFMGWFQQCITDCWVGSSAKTSTQIVLIIFIHNQYVLICHAGSPQCTHTFRQSIHSSQFNTINKALWYQSSFH
jgi:hypothetical protein